MRMVKKARWPILVAVFGIGLGLQMLVSMAAPSAASAAACAAPSVNYGSATANVQVPSAGTYKIWSRIMLPNASDNSYLLEVDGNQCFTVAASGASANSWVWVDYQNANQAAKITASLQAGNHTIKMIGNKPNVKLDRLIFTTNLSCLPVGTGNNCAGTSAPTPTPPATQPQAYNNKILVAPSKAAHYVRNNKATHIGNEAIMFCISVRRGAGAHINVSNAVINNYQKGSEGYCYYEQEPGLNFVREDGQAAVWLIQPGGTKLHVGVLCVPDPYTTPLKKFRVFVVPYGETAGHRDVGDYFGTPQRCGQLPG